MVVPFEVMASCRSVVALGRSVATETLVDDLVGVYFDEQAETVLIDASSRLRCLSLNSADINLHARQCNPAWFRRLMRVAVSRAWIQIHGWPFARPAWRLAGAVRCSRAAGSSPMHDDPAR